MGSQTTSWEASSFEAQEESVVEAVRGRGKALHLQRDERIGAARQRSNHSAATGS